MNLLAIPSSLSRSHLTFPLCLGDNLNLIEIAVYWLHLYMVDAQSSSTFQTKKQMKDENTTGSELGKF
jgi:hypothetical protein